MVRIIYTYIKLNFQAQENPPLHDVYWVVSVSDLHLSEKLLSKRRKKKNNATNLIENRLFTKKQGRTIIYL